MSAKKLQNKDNRLQFRLPVQTHIDLKVKALQSRVEHAELLTEAMEDAIAGRLGSLEYDGFQASSATIDPDLILRFKQFAKSKGVPQNAMLIRAVQAKLAKDKDQQESQK